MNLEDLSDANLLYSIREHARWQDPCEVHDDEGILLVAGPNDLPIGYRNCLVRVDPAVPASRVLERGRAFFNERGRRFAVLTRHNRDADLRKLMFQEGFKQRSDSPCMLIDHPLDDKEPPAGIRIERFTEERHVHDAIRVNAEAYEANKLPPEETHLFFGRPALLLSRHIDGYVAYRGNEPLSTAMTITNGEVGGIYWVGTVATAQRLGLGGICTRRATNAGFARGARVVTLQASPFGEPLYLRLGYRTYDRMSWFSAPSPR